MTETPSPAAFAAKHSAGLPELLAELGCSLALTTYQAGKVILIGSDGALLSHLPRSFDAPMGLAVDEGRMALATKDRLVLLGNEPRLAPSYPAKTNHYDALWVPRSVHFCGQLNMHDLAWGEDGLVGVNTLFSCLFRLDEAFSFVPVWMPPFISALAGEDRCHLNGLALATDQGEQAVVTALGTGDAKESWREDKLTGGALMSVPEGDVVVGGLAMPHSPRWVGGELYMLLAARGALVAVDLEEGRCEVIQQVPGFARGLTACGDYLFVGMSQLRPGRLFDVPLAEMETQCGVAVIHRLSGALVGTIEYLSSCEEIYDVQVLPGMRRPGIVGLETEMHARALSTPQETFWMEEREAVE